MTDAPRIAKSRVPAEQVREFGLKVGDTIEGTQRCGGYWNTTRLTLLWVGSTEAAWLEQSIGSTHSEWSDPEEETNWTLDCRPWAKVLTEPA